MLRGSLDFDKLYERLSGNIKYQSDRLKIKNGLHKRDGLACHTLYSCSVHDTEDVHHHLALF